MELTDGHVVLRPPQEGDLSLVRAASADSYIVEITSVPTPFTEEAGREWLARQRQRWEEGERNFVAREAGAEEPVGFTGLGRLRDPAVAQTGYWVLAHARRRGIAAATLRLVLRLAFDELEFGRVQALIEPWNEASIRVAESCGLRREGLLRGFYKGRDVYMYAILAGDQPHP